MWIKNFNKFNESSGQIDLGHFPIWSTKVAYRDGTIDEIISNFEIEYDDIVDQLLDIEDSTDLTYSFDQIFEVISIDEVRHNIKFKFEFKGGESKSIDSYIEYYQKSSNYISEIKNLSTKMQSFFGLKFQNFEVKTNHPIGKCGELEIYLHLVKIVKCGDKIRVGYLEHLKKIKNMGPESEILDPKIAADLVIGHMEKGGIQNASDYVSWTESRWGYEIYISLGGQEEYQITYEGFDEHGNKNTLIDWNYVDELIDRINSM